MITCSTPAISNPRAATSVATKIRCFWLVNDLIALILWFCLKSPCTAITSSPMSFSLTCRSSTLRLVFANMMIKPERFSNSSSKTLNLPFCETLILSWVIFSAGLWVGLTDILSGLVRYFFDRATMLFGMVAENRKVCLSFGMYTAISSSCSPKPTSNILSASSNTKNLVLLKFKVPRRKWSYTLPGVPTIN